ncbi:MAG: hypothetical protein U0802_22510 [Candidatus Binatia bacterium]
MPAKTSPRSQAKTLVSSLLERGEEVLGVFLEELGGNQRVQQRLGRTLSRAADAKRAVDQNLQTVLAALNLPSRADYKKLMAKIEALEGGLVNLGMKLDRLLAQREASAPPPVRRPPKARVKAPPPLD